MLGVFHVCRPNSLFCSLWDIWPRYFIGHLLLSNIKSDIHLIPAAPQSYMQSDSLDRCHTLWRARLSWGCHKVSGWTWLVNPLWTKIGNGGRCNHTVTENDVAFQSSMEICLKLILTLKVTVMWSEKTLSLLDSKANSLRRAITHYWSYTLPWWELTLQRTWPQISVSALGWSLHRWNQICTINPNTWDCVIGPAKMFNKKYCSDLCVVCCIHNCFFFFHPWNQSKAFAAISYAS